MPNRPNATGRLIAIGDIHGHAVTLQTMLDLIRPTADDTIVTLGDYVNRGPETCQTLEILSALRETCQHVAILGNHDEMMIDARCNAQAVDRWLYKGGDLTLKSYGSTADLADVPDQHWQFLEACQPIYETEQFFFTHANYCWHSPLDEQPSRLLRWTPIEVEPPRPHLNGKIAIVGHSPGKLRDMGFCRCLDTGCSIGGLLTAMEVTTRRLWQVTETGEVVSP